MNKRAPLVSIVIPVFNSEKFLQETIESVLAQTYTRWELLLVDDGSTDASPRIAHHYVEQYPQQIRYLEHSGHQNYGVCSSRNLGISHAEGDFIAFLDADDIWLSHKLEQQIGIMEVHSEVGMVYSMSRYWSSWKQPLVKFSQDYVPNPRLKTNTLYQPRSLTTICYPLGKAQAPCPSNILLRRCVVEAVGGFEESFQRSHQLYEDQAFLSKVYLTTASYVADACWDLYRLHDNSCMARTKNYGEIRLFFLHWFESYLTKYGIEDEQIWQALQRAYWPYQHPYLYQFSTFPDKAVQQMKRWIRKAALLSIPS